MLAGAELDVGDEHRLQQAAHHQSEGNGKENICRIKQQRGLRAFFFCILYHSLVHDCAFMSCRSMFVHFEEGEEEDKDPSEAPAFII